MKTEFAAMVLPQHYFGTKQASRWLLLASPRLARPTSEYQGIAPPVPVVPNNNLNRMIHVNHEVRSVDTFRRLTYLVGH